MGANPRPTNRARISRHPPFAPLRHSVQPILKSALKTEKPRQTTLKTPIPTHGSAAITPLAIAIIAAALFAALAIASAARADTPTAYAEICANGIAVPNPRANEGLLRDCAILLQAKDALAADPPLNWSADASIYDWEGIKIYELQDIPHENERARVIWLELRERGLSGSIPRELARLERLHRIDFAHNRLIGGIPRELAGLEHLNTFVFRHNELSGRIPTEIGNPTHLLYVDLAHNQLTGSIPPQFENLDHTSILNLEYNQLSGHIPPELGGMQFIHHLNLAHNRLTGSIPSELGNLDNLEGLNLSGNRLTGHIPPELGAFRYGMRYLDIGSNQLTGHIPPELGNLDRLSRLDISANQLTGQIPTEFANLANLIELHMSGNQLSGCIPPALNAAALHDLERLDLPLCGSGEPPAPCISCIYNENRASRRIPTPNDGRHIPAFASQ